MSREKQSTFSIHIEKRIAIKEHRLWVLFIVNVPIDPHELKQRETNFVEPILLKFSCITNVFWRLRQETVNNKKKNLYCLHCCIQNCSEKESSNFINSVPFWRGKGRFMRVVCSTCLIKQVLLFPCRWCIWSTWQYPVTWSSRSSTRYTYQRWHLQCFVGADTLLPPRHLLKAGTSSLTVHRRKGLGSESGSAAPSFLFKDLPG